MVDYMAVIDQLRDADVECFTREEWGSARPEAYIARRKSHPMRTSPAKYHFLHITVTNDTDTVQEGKAGAKQIEGFGYSTPPQVSYQDLVTNEGKYFQGQDYGNKGTHTVNDKNVQGFPKDLNYEGYATALMQNVGDEVTDVQVKVVAMVFAARELAGLVVKNAPIFPHRKFANKSCPGDKAMARLDEIIKLKNSYVKAGKLPAPPKKDEPVKNEDKSEDELRSALAVKRELTRVYKKLSLVNTKLQNARAKGYTSKVDDLRKQRDRLEHRVHLLNAELDEAEQREAKEDKK